MRIMMMGVGRLPSLVPIEWAERFQSQRRKFNMAVFEYEPEPVRKHGEAMLRAYHKLEELAVEAGYESVPPIQWEIETDAGLIILVRDIADTGRVELAGRKAQVWSLDEIAGIIAAHPVLVATKEAFPGAVVESIRPAKVARDALNDELLEIPF